MNHSIFLGHVFQHTKPKLIKISKPPVIIIMYLYSYKWQKVFKSIYPYEDMIICSGFFFFSFTKCNTIIIFKSVHFYMYMYLYQSIKNKFQNFFKSWMYWNHKIHHPYIGGDWKYIKTQVWLAKFFLSIHPSIHPLTHLFIHPLCNLTEMWWC